MMAQVSPNEPMAIVQMAIVQVESSPIPAGKYYIKNQAENLFWVSEDCKGPLKTVHFWLTEVKDANNFNCSKVIEHSPIIQVGHHT